MGTLRWHSMQESANPALEIGRTTPHMGGHTGKTS